MNDPETNFFYKQLSKHYAVEFSDEPDVVFYSCFGENHLKYTCTRIFYSPENWRPDYSQCDYSMTFDRLDDSRHLRLPLWALYAQKELLLDDDAGTAANRRYEDWLKREKFCCFVVSNGHAPERREFYEMLNSRLRVDSAGKWNNTIGREIPAGTENKLKFIRDYRFVISFENASYPGYTTEKIIEPLMAGCIPIYWGDPEVGRDINSQRFIYVADKTRYEEVIEKILAIERDRKKALPLLDQPAFEFNRLPVYMEEDYVSDKLYAWIGAAKAGGFRGVGARPRARLRYYSNICKSGLRRIKRKIAQ
jgi:hypothetical protein